MGKFLDALKNLGNKLNGTTPSSTTTVAVINEIADDFANGTTATKAYVNSLMSGALKRAIVEELPTEDIDTNTIYMVLDETAAQGNVYNEYLYINEAWELIGTTEVQTPHLYAHYINMQITSSQHTNLTIYTNDNTQFTVDTLLEWLTTNGFNASNNNYYTANGYADLGQVVLGIAPSTTENMFTVSLETISNGALSHTTTPVSKYSYTLTDTVKQIF